jgi:hypothetical protein
MALNFSGSQYMVGAYATAPALYPLSVSLWIRPTTATSGALVVVGELNSAIRMQVTYLGATQSVNCVTSTTETLTSGPASATNSCPLNAWAHLVGVFASASSRSTYLNGVLIGTDSNTALARSAPTHLVLGARYGPALGAFYNGDMAEVGIYSESLSAASILALARGATPDQVRPQALVAYMPLVRDSESGEDDLRGGVPSYIASLGAGGAPTSAPHPRVYA